MPTVLAAAWLVQDRLPLGEGEGAYLGCPVSGELLGVLVGLASVTFQSTVFSGNCGQMRTAKGAVGHQEGSSKRSGRLRKNEVSGLSSLLSLLSYP